MLERIDSRYLLILGFRAAKVNDPKASLAELRGSFPNAEVQLLRADRVAGSEHLAFAVRNALKAFSQKYKRSRTIAMEILLYASCQRQISKAIQTLGVTAQTGDIAMVAVSKSQGMLMELTGMADSILGGRVDSEVLEIESKTKLAELKRSFGIGERELEAARQPGETDNMVAKRLILERSALLALAG